MSLPPSPFTAALLTGRRRFLLLLLPLAVAGILLVANVEDETPVLAAVHATDGAALHAYRVRIEAKPIAGLAEDVSGLTYDPDRKTLFTITNQHPEIVELSLTGEVLRRIPLGGVGDPEAIEYVGPGQYVVTDERRQALVGIRIADDTRQIDAGKSRQFVVGIGANGNKGFEGLAYDRRGDRLFVAKEKNPIRIYEIGGFPLRDGEPARPLTLVEHAERDDALPVRDLSSVYYDERSGRLLLLSDDSRAVVEIDGSGRAVSKLNLRAGRHGLTADVPQAEGLAMDAAGNLYVVSEPNLFYVFSRQD